MLGTGHFLGTEGRSRGNGRSRGVNPVLLGVERRGGLEQGFLRCDG